MAATYWLVAVTRREKKCLLFLGISLSLLRHSRSSFVDESILILSKSPTEMKFDPLLRRCFVGWSLSPSLIGLSRHRRFCWNLQRRWCLVLLFTRRCSPPVLSIPSPWRFRLFYFVVPVNSIPSIRIENFVSMMRCDSVIILLSLSLLLHRLVRS